MQQVVSSAELFQQAGGYELPHAHVSKRQRCASGYWQRQRKSSYSFLSQFRIIPAGLDRFSAAPPGNRTSSVAGSCANPRMGHRNSFFLRHLLLAHLLDDSLRWPAHCAGVPLTDSGRGGRWNLSGIVRLIRGAGDPAMGSRWRCFWRRYSGQRSNGLAWVLRVSFGTRSVTRRRINSFLIQAATWGGVYAVSFLIVAINSAIVLVESSNEQCGPSRQHWRLWFCSQL